ncbi:hypothetical protein ADUPG1_009452 [Aduncisulcus paluster]|uniref:Uncharacterized protein n=1 Tax=Aduncisulcus paluster TaxID=2918883 RepID=A0ABQ5KYF7_9EUKA|nr:hypothetical protein ADUPG1_009452 [Aduncisulcus paluster]
MDHSEDTSFSTLPPSSFGDSSGYISVPSSPTHPSFPIFGVTDSLSPCFRNSFETIDSDCQIPNTPPISPHDRRDDLPTISSVPSLAFTECQTSFSRPYFRPICEEEDSDDLVDSLIFLRENGSNPLSHYEERRFGIIPGEISYMSDRSTLDLLIFE